MPKAAGRPMVLSVCEWGDNRPWEWAEPLGHLWRTTGDITDCWDCRLRWSYGVKQILDMQVELADFAGPGHWNDPDMLEVGNEGLTFEESRAHFSLWCMLAAPLMAGNDVRTMSPEIRDILTDRDAIAIDQDPLGKQGYRVFADKHYEIWFKPLENDELAVCVLNVADTPAEIAFDWNRLQSMPGGTFKIRDLWRKADAGTTKEKFRQQLKSHDVALLRLSPSRAAN
jgi:alpha-galactosidase